MPRPHAPSRFATRFGAALAAGTVAVGLAACGTSNSVDQESLESGVLDAAPPQAQVESASCPDDVSSDVGTEFECTVTTAEGEVQIGATVTSEGDEDVEFEVTTVDGQKITE